MMHVQLGNISFEAIHRPLHFRKMHVSNLQICKVEFNTNNVEETNRKLVMLTTKQPFFYRAHTY